MSTWASVGEIMDTVVPTLNPDKPILEAVDYLLENRVTGAPVIDSKQRILGILTEFDCLRILAEGGLDADVPRGNVSDYMSVSVTTVPPRMDIYYAAGVFLANRFRRLPVVDGDGRVVGAITRLDILRAIQKARA